MPLTSSNNLSFLVEIRHRHQTKEAEKGVRRTGMALLGGQSSASSDTHCVSVEPVSEHRQLTHKIHEIMKAVDGSEDVGTSTGLNRQVRWTKTPGLYSPAPSHLGSLTGGTGKSGNSTNAMEAAQKAANMVCFQVCPLSVMDSSSRTSLQVVKKCRGAFANLPHVEKLSTAKVNGLFALVRGSYSIVLIKSELMIGQGMSSFHLHLQLENDLTTRTSANNVQERWRQIWVTLLDQGMPKYQHAFVHCRASVASEPRTTLPMQDHSRAILTSGAPLLCPHPPHLIPFCFAHWFRLKKRTWDRDQSYVHG
jgi:hypothetical protein